MKEQKKIVIDKLRALGVRSGRNGESLHGMDYQSLVRLLAVKRAVAE